MKKVIVGLLLVLSLASIGFLAYRFVKYTEYDKTINEKKNYIKKMEEELASEEKLIKEAQDKENKIKEENKDKIEELEKWQKRAEKVGK